MLYRTLEVKPSATTEEIRTSYRRLALQHHPDRCGGTPEAIAQFQTIQKAYEALSNEESRAKYDEEISAKRAKFKGFVKPNPFEPGTIEKPVAYKLADDSMYTFESAPSRTHSGWNYGDIVSHKDQSGCYVGMAADQWHYWCASGTAHASRLCQAGSSFGMSEVKVMYRCNLGAKPVGTSAAAIPRARPRTAKEKAEGKKKLEQMKQALQQKERARAAPRLIDRLLADERGERQDTESLLWVKHEELLSTVGTLLHCLESGLPIPEVGRAWMNRSASSSGAISSLQEGTSRPLTSTPAVANSDNQGADSNRAWSNEFGQDDEDAARRSPPPPASSRDTMTAEEDEGVTAAEEWGSPLNKNASAGSETLLPESIDFRYTNSTNAASPMDADVSYQFHELSAAVAREDATNLTGSIEYVDLTGTPDESMSDGAASQCCPDREDDHNHAGQAGPVSHEKSAEAVAVEPSGLATHEVTKSAELGVSASSSGPVRARSSTSQSPCASVQDNDAHHLTSDQLTSLNRALLSHASSNANLAGMPQLLTPTTTVTSPVPLPNTHTPRTTTMTTTVATTTTSPSLPPPSVTTVRAGTAADAASSTSPRLEAGAGGKCSSTRDSALPVVTKLDLRAPTQSATSPLSVTPGLEVLTTPEEEETPSARAPAAGHHGCITSELDRGCSDSQYSTDAHGLAGTNPPTAITTPSSAHLSSAGPARRTPRFMQATKAFSNRTNGSPRYTPRQDSFSPAHEALAGGEDAPAPAPGSPEFHALAATYSGPDPHAHKSAHEMFEEEMAFMKEFEKKRKAKRSGGNW